MSPSAMASVHPVIVPNSLLMAEAYAVEIYQLLDHGFPDDPCLEHCLQSHRDRFLALELWLHRQCKDQVQATDDGAFAHVQLEELTGSLDVALTCLACCEACLLEEYRWLVLEVDLVSAGRFRAECLAGQRQTVETLTRRRSQQGQGVFTPNHHDAERFGSLQTTTKRQEISHGTH